MAFFHSIIMYFIEKTLEGDVIQLTAIHTYWQEEG